MNEKTPLKASCSSGANTAIKPTVRDGLDIGQQYFAVIGSARDSSIAGCDIGRWVQDDAVGGTGKSDVIASIGVCESILSAFSKGIGKLSK